MAHAGEDKPEMRISKSSLTPVASSEAIAEARRRAAERMNLVHHRAPLGRRLLDVLRNLAWVVPLTLLVWLFAERENVVPKKDIPVAVQVKSELPDRFVALVAPADKIVKIDLRGTSQRVDDARDLITREQGIKVVVPAATPTGREVTLPAVDVISANKILADRGITVENVQPDTLTVYVDELVSTKMQPHLPREVVSHLDGPVVFDPPTVTLKGPKADLTSTDKPAEVIAQVTEAMLSKVPGEQDIAGIPVTLAKADERITISPAVVKVHVRIRSAAVTAMLQSVPVFVAAPPEFFEKYRVFPRGGFMSRITVVGPEDQIKAIQSGEFRPRAILELSDRDVQQRLPKVPEYKLPPDVKVAREDQSRTVDYDITERSRLE